MGKALGDVAEGLCVIFVNHGISLYEKLVEVLLVDLFKVTKPLSQKSEEFFVSALFLAAIEYHVAYLKLMSLDV